MDSWNPGDLAECIHDHPWFDQAGGNSTEGPTFGETRMVRDVYRVRMTVGGDEKDLGEYLVFDRYRPNFYQSGCFRKITPRADDLVVHDAAFLDRWIKQPETTVTINRWQTFASAAIVASVTLWVGVESLVAVLTRAPA